MQIIHAELQTELQFVTGFWKTVPNHTFIIGYSYL